ncbi:MAG: GLUG motif-containing protein, partial [Planctomycetota bacterium]
MRNMMVTSRATAVLVLLIFVSLPFSTVNLNAELSLYIDGEPARGFTGWFSDEPPRTLGIHSDTTAAWHGYVLSEGFPLLNGHTDDTKIPQGATSIIPYDAPFGYEMTTDGFAETGVQFTMEMHNDPCAHEGLITLWDANSLFHVPVDTLYIWEGGAPGTCGRDFVADAGGPYRIAEGQTLRLDATGSTCMIWYCGDPEPRTGSIIGHTCMPYWHIGGVDFAFGLTAEIGYDELVNGLGLTPGTYELLLLLKWPLKGSHMARTTIVVEKYGGGTGEPNDPYQIWDANHMQAIGADANDWDKHFILMADIDLGQFDGKDGRERFNVVGRGYYDDEWVNIPFSGEFDGNNHTIAGFTYDSNDDDEIGLFGYVDDPNAQIRNLGLTEPNIDVPTGEMIGSLVGRLREGTIANCSIEDGSVSGRTYVGGLVGGFMHDPAGGNSSGIVSNCHYTGSVSGDHSVGGLVGASWGTVTNCYSGGDVTGRAHVGGLAGANWGTVTNCFSSGDVTGSAFVGGLAGSNPGTITGCYSKSDVLAISRVGGLVGSNYGMLPVAGHAHVSGTIAECYSTGSVEGNESVGGLSGHCFEGEISNSY